MALPDLVLRGERVVTSGATRRASVHVGNGEILAVRDFDDVPPGWPIVEAGNLVVMPGLVDTHVRVGAAPDAFGAVTRAAAAGGVTTLIDMPAGEDAAITVSSLQARRDSASGKCLVDVGFWTGLVPENLSEIAGLARSGVFGFACALDRAGPRALAPLTERDLREAMPLLAGVGLPLLVRAEMPESGERPRPRSIDGWRRRKATYLASHPKSRENDGIALVLRLCREFRARTHLAPLSSSDGLTPLYHARAAGLPISSETCPHYLHFVAEEIPDTGLACTPPIRDRGNRELLWGALKGRLIQSVVSDHAPAPPARRFPWLGDFSRARPGISTLPWGLALTWTAASKRGFSFADLSDWMCRAPAQLAGLSRKGVIAAGRDADFVLWDPGARSRVPRSAAGAVTPYEGLVLDGVVESTYLRGEVIYEKEKFGPPRGQLLAPA